MPNLLNDVMPKILSSALVTLRENAVMPRLVNSDYSSEASRHGNVINVPVPTRMQATDVIPGPYAPASPNLQLDTVPVVLDQWKDSYFTLTDKEMGEIYDGAVSMQITEAARAIANAIDYSLLSLYKNIYNYVGTAGTTPFASSPADAITARKLLSKGLAPINDRRIVLTPDAESNALSLTAFQYYQNSGSIETMRNGEIGRKFGFDWYMDQNAMYHTAGNLAGTLVTSGTPSSVATADNNIPALRNPRTINSITIAGGTAGQTLKQGDVFSVAGDSQTYVVNADATAIAGGNIVVSFSPAPKVVWASGSAVTVRASREINLAFQKDAIALAIRPLEQSVYSKDLGGMKSLTMVDDLTGIPMRLIVRQEHMQMRMSLDCLWGRGLVRPENALVIAG